MTERTSTVVLIPWQIQELLTPEERTRVVEFNSNWYSVAVIDLADGTEIVFKKNDNKWERKSTVV